MENLYVSVNNETEYNKIINVAKNSKYNFRFPNNLNTDYKTAKKNYHGNSKLLINLFYNDIIGKYEMRITTKTIELSYPHIKRIRTETLENAINKF